MKKLFALLALMALPSFLAQAEEPDFQVEVDPEVYSAKDFARKGVKTGKIPPRVKRPDAIPTKQERDTAFGCVPGLAEEIQGMDELDRDLLFVRARTKPLKELSKIYPSLDQKKLAALSKELRK